MIYSMGKTGWVVKTRVDEIGRSRPCFVYYDNGVEKSTRWADATKNSSRKSKYPEVPQDLIEQVKPLVKISVQAQEQRESERMKAKQAQEQHQRERKREQERESRHLKFQEKAKLQKEHQENPKLLKKVQITNILKNSGLRLIQEHSTAIRGYHTFSGDFEVVQHDPHEDFIVSLNTGLTSSPKTDKWIEDTKQQIMKVLDAKNIKYKKHNGSIIILRDQS